MKGNIRIRNIFLFFLAASLLMSLVLSISSCARSNTGTYVNMDNIQLVQLDEVKNGDPIAIIKTNMGDIKAVLYPEYAPKTVANFISLAESGYYDGTYIFNVEPDVYFSAGSADKYGSLKENYNKENEEIPIELHGNLWPLRGAFCTLSETAETSFWKRFTGKTVEYSGSRFLVCNSIKMTDEIKQNLLDTENGKLVADAFIKKGGIPNFSQQLTVFAQTYEGFEIIDKITSAQVTENGDNKIPSENITIYTIKISSYSSDGIN